ncbi:MAG: hypothetical protein V7K69_27395 [Nostoc sp.]
MINRNQVFIKFDLNTDQRNIFDQLTLAQQRRLIKVLEGKQRQRRVIKASSNPNRAKAKPLSKCSDNLGNISI